VHSDAVPVWGDRRRTRVGLLGGSFNPAHAGHRHIAELARRRLRLHQVWLLVSPGNPLKPRAGMAPLAQRLAAAAGIADGRRVVATAIEARLRTRYTADTLPTLRRRFPLARFVWLMGADNLADLPRWRQWPRIVAAMPFAVLPRPGYNRRALAGQAAQCLAAARRPVRQASLLSIMAAPAWLFLPAPQHAASATALRLAGGFPAGSETHAAAHPACGKGAEP
jgi:nicotinate-nucleotide adenylyltransferase